MRSTAEGRFKYEIINYRGGCSPKNYFNLFNISREESNADVEHYKKVKQAEANSRLYTDQYVRLELAKALSNNTKYFFSGENSVLGGLLSKIMN